MNGSHGFDKNLNYNATFYVPAKYLGNQVTSLLSQIKSEEVKNISIPITATIKGNYTSPNISTDVASSTGNLVKKLIEIKAQEAIKDIAIGNDKVDEILDLIKGDTSIKNDSTSTSTPTINSGSIIKDVTRIFGKKKQKDSTKTQL